MKKELLGEKYWYRGSFSVAGDDEPNNSIIGRVRIAHQSSIICLKTRAQVEWLIKSLSEAVEHTWDKSEN